MVMPRSRSMSMESRICSFISRAGTLPHSWMSRSESVDLPWSMWAMIAKLRIRLVSVMGRCLASLGHGEQGRGGGSAQWRQALGPGVNLTYRHIKTAHPTGWIGIVAREGVALCKMANQ